jgi:hypothetical protein
LNPSSADPFIHGYAEGFLREFGNRVPVHDLYSRRLRYRKRTSAAVRRMFKRPALFAPACPVPDSARSGPDAPR